MGFYKGDWRPSSSKRGRWKENKTDGGGEPNHHHTNLACSFPWHSDDKKEQVTLLAHEYYLIIEKYSATENCTVPYNEKTDAAKEISAHHFSGCPVDHKKQQFYVSQAVGKSLKATVSLLAK